MKRFFVSIFLVFAFFLQTQAQTAREFVSQYPEKAWVSHAVYPVDMIKERAETPKGYAPFYVSHYGRHGSRCDRDENSWKHMIQRLGRLDSMGVLTPLGKRVKVEVERLLALQKGKFGMLTEIGAEQHRGIAARLYESCPEIFTPGCSINSVASTSKRCIASMKAFNESLKEKDPTMKQEMSWAKEVMGYARPGGSNNPMNAREIRHDYEEFRKAKDTKWYLERRAFQKKDHDDSAAERMVRDCRHSLKGITSVSHLTSSAFRLLMFGKNLGVDETDLVREIFSDDIIYNIYLNQNYSWYSQHACVGNHPVAQHLYVIKYLVDNMIERADRAIAGDYPYVADFRFGHDTHLTPIVASFGFCEHPEKFLSVEEAGEQWWGFAVTPMGGNLQMILYRKAGKKPDVLVRFLLNENDVTLPIKSKTAPFYPWEEFKKYAEKRFEYLKTK